MRTPLIAASSLAATSLAALALTGLAPASATSPKAQPCAECKAGLEAAVASPLRAEDKARDVYRHPVETLSFFGVEPGMKVGEYAPGGEWYSRLLGLYLGPKGHLVGLYFDPDNKAFKPETREGILKGAANYPADVARFTGLPADRFAAYSLGAVPAGEEGTFDRILVIRMMHNMLRWNIADGEIAAMRKLLKPGGLIGIVQHRAKPDAPFAYADGSKGYLREKDLIAFMQVEGFDLVAASEINANAKDPANWPDGVWTLPPTLTLKDQDRAKYQAVGESDRMTLLFRKRP